MVKYYKHAVLALAAGYLVGCSGGGFCNNNSTSNNGDVSTLQIIAPKIIYSKTSSISSSYVTVINPTTTAVKNLHYTLNNPVGSGSLASIDETTANNCAVIPANSQCNFKLNVAGGAVAGSLGISANNDSSLMAKLFKSNQSATSVTLPVGIEQAYYNSIAGADGITVSYYHTVIAGVPYILVSGIVASDKAGSFNNVVLVDGNGNALPNQQLISGNVSSAQGSTFNVLLSVSSISGISQTIKVQTRQIAADGSITVVSTATAANTLTTTSGVGIADLLPGAVYLTSANPEQIITFVNNGDAMAQLQSLAASNPNMEVVFSPTSLNSGGMTTATFKLKNSASSATSGSATLSYNNGKEEVKTAAIVEQNISPQPNPNPSPSPTSVPTPPVPTAGLTAVLTPDSNFYTTTAIGTVSRQLALTNTGSTTETGFVLTLPTNFTISAGSSNSCTVTQGTSPATISDNLAANGGSCNINITYANTTATVQNTGTISVAYNYNGGTAATPATTGVNYQVTQSTANLTLTPNPVTFTNVLNNNVDYNQQTVTVTNSGDETATNLGFSISGTNSGLFSVIAGGTCASGGVLPNITGSNTCTITTQFGTFTSTVDPSNKTANLDVNYFPYSGAGATITTASSVLNGQATAAQSASIAQGAATGSGFAGGDGNSNTPYQIEKNATTPSISYTITNSGAVAANSFYLSGSASGYTIGGNCGTSSSPVTLAANTGSCTTTFTLNSTASTGSQNLDVSGITMHWVDQDSPSGQAQNMNGTQYVNVYVPATIAITTSPASSISIAPGDSFTITATLTDGYNESAQIINAALTTGTQGAVTFTNNNCTVSSQNNSCTITVNAGSGVAPATGDVITLSNTTTPAMSPTPATVSFAIAPAFPRVDLPQTGQMYCVPGTTFTTTCGSGYTSVAGTDGYGRNIPSYGDYIPYGVAWAYNGTGTLNPLTRFSAGTQADGTTACQSGQEVRNDSLTGLMWVQNPNPTSYAWQDFMDPNSYPAQATIDAMNTSGYCGYNDWRLPNVNELASLVNQGAANTATWLKLPAQGFGTNVQASNYWSSTTSALNTGSAWTVNMDTGEVGGSDKAWGTNPVWPVRGTTALPAQIPQTGQTTSYAANDDGALQKGTTGTTASGRFVAGSGTEADCITDQQTGLIWVKDLNTVNSGNAASSWSNAISIASGTWCGHTDWRLPNRNELHSLVNYGQSDIASWLNNPAQGFSNARTGGGGYWSSTTYANGTSAAWYVDMTDGLVNSAPKSTGLKYVWPVRGGQ